MYHSMLLDLPRTPFIYDCVDWGISGQDWSTHHGSSIPISFAFFKICCCLTKAWPRVLIFLLFLPLLLLILQSSDCQLVCCKESAGVLQKMVKKKKSSNFYSRFYMIKLSVKTDMLTWQFCLASLKFHQLKKEWQSLLIGQKTIFVSLWSVHYYYMFTLSEKKQAEDYVF